MMIIIESEINLFAFWMVSMKTIDKWKVEAEGGQDWLGIVVFINLQLI